MPYIIDGMVSGADKISALFNNNEEPETVEEPQESETEDNKEDKNEKVTEITSPEDLFGEKESEKVGDDDDDITEGEEEITQRKKSGSSPANLFSSVANSLAESGYLPNLSEEDLNNVKDGETFTQAFNKELEARLDATTKRVNDALNAGMDVPVIQQYEHGIQYLDSLTNEMIEAETAEGENLRKGIIYQYQLNLGVNEKRAQKEVERAIASGTDIEDAKEYLETLKTSLKDKYNELIEDGKKQMQAQKEAIEENAKKMKKSMLEDEKILGDIVVDKVTRQKAFDNLMKPTYKTKEGVYQSEMQKYISENPQDFQMKVALLYTMTDGFKNMNNVLKETVKKEKKKAMKDLESAINNTSRVPSGSLNLNFNDGNTTFRGKKIAPPELWN